MNNQEAFTIVRRALLKQNAQSRKSDGHCAYRGNDGLKCAVGHLIPDTCYREEYDKRCISDDDPAWPLAEILEDGGILGFEGDLELLTELQDIHDTNSPDEWPRQFEIVAEDWGLKLEP